MQEHNDMASEAVAEVVAAHMSGWRPVAGRECTLENSAEGLRVKFTTNQYGIPSGRVKIAAVMPSTPDFFWHYAYGVSEPKPDLSITCAIRRGGAAIAGDIDRRLLPEYREAMARVLPVLERHERHKQRQEDAIRFFEATFNTQRIGHKPRTIPSRSEVNGHWTADVTGGKVSKLLFEDLDLEIAAHLIQEYEQAVGSKTKP